MNAQGVNMPVLLGGAALTRDYAEDDLAEPVQGPAALLQGRVRRPAHDGRDRRRARSRRSSTEQKDASASSASDCATNAVKPPDRATPANVPKVAQDNPVPLPPFWGRRVVKDISPRHVFPFINENALFMGQWGFKKGGTERRGVRQADRRKGPAGLRAAPEAAPSKKASSQPKVVYGYFPVQCAGRRPDRLPRRGIPARQVRLRRRPRRTIVPHGTPASGCGSTSRARKAGGGCASRDFFRSTESRRVRRARRAARHRRRPGHRAAPRSCVHDNQYQDYLYLHGFGVESAEALAEFWHKRMRQELGFGSEDDPSIRELFQQKYRGSRYSFGYPACPDLEDRDQIVELLQPRGDRRDAQRELHARARAVAPTRSSSHHPQAKYFDVVARAGGRAAFDAATGVGSTTAVQPTSGGRPLFVISRRFRYETGGSTGRRTEVWRRRWHRAKGRPGVAPPHFRRNGL